MVTRNRNSPTDRLQTAMQTARIRNASELARKLGLPRQTVHRWLADGIANITYKNLLKLADTLNVNARWIVFGEIGPLKPPIKEQDEADAAGIARALTGELRKNWLFIGRCMLEHQASDGSGRKSRKSPGSR